MLRIEFTFPGGRYHATPWGSHVNEGRVEWPPSPWRIARALLAVGFTRLGWTETPGAARSLLEKLASSTPRYALPEAVEGHARHYMPIRDNTTKVFDAFAYVGAAPVGVEYDLDLGDDEHAVAKELVERLPYLGRAESWVSASVVSSLRGAVNCVAATSELVSGAAIVEVLAAEPTEQLIFWRTRALEDAWGRKLAQKREEAEKKGKAPPTSLGKADQAKIAALFPATVIDALQIETSTLQKQGWSMPPGSRWVRYVHEVVAARRVSTRRALPERSTTALLALSSDTRRVDVLPPFRDALRRIELLHRSLVSFSDLDRSGHGSPVFTGQDVDGNPLVGHAHATLLPLSLGRRSDRLDHVLVHAPMGFDARAKAALGAVRKTYAPGIPDVFVTLVGLGRTADFVNDVPEVRRARVWRNTTPFVPTRHPKSRGQNTLEELVQRDLEQRGLPKADLVELELDDGSFAPLADWQAMGGAAPRPSTRFRHFRRERETRPPPVRLALGLRLHFAAPVAGPLALGYGSHFGLGAFRPDEG